MKRLVLLIAGLSTLLYAIGLIWIESPLGILSLYWHAVPFEWARFLPLAVSRVAYALLVLLMMRGVAQAGGVAPWVVIASMALAIGLGFVMQMAAINILEPEPFRAILRRHYSYVTGGYWSVGMRVQDLGDYLDHFSETMSGYPVHSQRHPPGLPLIFWLGTWVMGLFPTWVASLDDWLRPMACYEVGIASLNSAQLASVLFGAALEMLGTWLTVIPLYCFVRKIATQRAALWAVLLYPLMPGVTAWATQFDRTFPLVTVLTLLMCEALLHERRRWAQIGLAAGLGVMLSLVTFASLGNLPIIMLGAIYAALRMWHLERLTRLGQRIWQGGIVLVGIASVWLYAIAKGLDVFKMYQVSMDFHYELIRPFIPWAFLHAFDIFSFIGLAFVVIGFGYAAFRFRPDSAVPQARAALAMAFVVPLTLLCLLHVARGETGRVWMFFSPLGLILAALVLSEAYLGRYVRLFVVGLVALQGVTQLATMRVLYFLEDAFNPDGVASATVPANLQPAQFRYDTGGAIALLGYTLGKDETASALSTGQDRTLTLYWQQLAERPSRESYKVFIHVMPTKAYTDVVLAHDSMPMEWKLPTTCWRPGQIVRDVHVLDVQHPFEPGNYFAVVGLYGAESNGRVGVYSPPTPSNAPFLPQPLAIKE